MGTPAVNIVEVVTGNALKYTSFAGGPEHVSVFTNYSAGGRIELRPASVSHPIDRTGWREPTPWFHQSCTLRETARGEALRDFGPFDEKSRYTAGSDAQSTGPALLSTADLDKNLENRALIAALSKLKSQSFNTGVFVGEGRETIDLLATSVYRIIGTIRKYKSANPKEWARMAKNLKSLKGRNVLRKLIQRTESNGAVSRHLKKDLSFRREAAVLRGIPESWLEVQYGWIPLMSDIAGACKELSRVAEKTLPRVMVTGFARDKVVTRHRYTGGGVGVAFADISTEIEAFCKVTLYYEPENAEARLKSRLGLTNPAEIVWELTPWSFVADWFYTIGPWLGVLDADSGWVFKSGTCSLRKKGTEKVLGYGLVPGTDPTWKYSSLVPSLWDHDEFTRRVYSTSPVPAPYVKGPLSPMHTVNLLALLAAAL